MLDIKRRLLSWLLLTVYVLVVLHQNVPISLTSEEQILPKSATTHHHEEFQEVHHEHRFHVGIFHFVGHLFEKLNHADDHADEHIAIAQKTSTEKVINLNKTVYFYCYGNSFVPLSVDTASLPRPPPYNSDFLQISIPDNTPLRGPPSFV